jgi:hypothetical protein
MGIKTYNKKEELKKEIKRNSSGTFHNNKPSLKQSVNPPLERQKEHTRVTNKSGTTKKVLSSNLKQGVTTKSSSISGLNSGMNSGRRQRSSRMTTTLEKVISYEPVL